ncbi:aromatic prenyltransferase [Frankia sp. CiP3]|uniref:aromatic prenyltransferase n=1 Tax=Frankia sp. CiP3 TaxID=2880971 RepID=UPI001EF5DA48|nr:aromatic prenyltransferase [Frankia sp. CiP3]
MTSLPSQFSAQQFLRDAKTTADAIGSGYSESVTRTVVNAYAQSFHEGAVLWRATDKPGATLNYRFYERRVTDTIGVAVRAGLLSPDNKMAYLINSWGDLYGGTPTELCDFDAERGLSKTWLYLGGIRPVEDILAVPAVPEPIRRHEPLFRDLGLVAVRHVAVDYHHDTANIYFRTAQQITPQQCEQFISLARGKMPGDAVLKDMSKFTAPDGYTFSVTMSVDDGVIQRVGFYALRLPLGEFPSIDERLRIFFRTAPSHDEEEMNAVAWSFGPEGTNYMKAERSYCGQLVALMKAWNSPMASIV